MTEHDINAFNFLCDTLRSAEALHSDGSIHESLVYEMAGFVLISDPIIGPRLRSFVRGKDMDKKLFNQTIGRVLRAAKKYLHKAYFTIDTTK
jgi:hypothetical protein